MTTIDGADVFEGAGGGKCLSRRGFILQPTYRVEGGRAVVWLFGRLADGRTFLVRDRRQVPRFWVRAADAAAARRLGVETVAPDGTTTMGGEAVCAVEGAAPGDLIGLRDRLRAAGIATYEGDVPFATRFLFERGIRGAVEIAGEERAARGAARVGGAGAGDDPVSGSDGVTATAPAAARPSPCQSLRGAVGGSGEAVRDLRVDVVFDEPELAPGDWSPALSVLSLDIETDPSASRLLSVALYMKGIAGEVVAAEVHVVDEAAGVSEREVLETFARRVRELDPDVLTGWNVVDFDLAVLQRLAERHRLEGAFEFGRAPGPMRLLRSRGFWRGMVASVPGRLVLDGLDLLRGAFIRTERSSLDAVAREVLGEGKTITGHARASEILRQYHEERASFIEYNLTDARLVVEILEKLNLVPLAVERSRLTGMAPDRVSGSIASFDFLYLSELSRRKIVAPTVGDAAAEEVPTEGGHVLEPVTGLHRNVCVFDFRSLYPSVIRTFQIDPAGLIDDAARATDARTTDARTAEARTTDAPTAEARTADARTTEGEAAPAGDDDTPIVAPNGAAFRRTPRGILPRMLDDLFPRREQAQREGDGITSQAIKILMNSFYGVLGTPACRFYDPRLANAITSFGREMLLWTKARCEALGHEVLYGDTDSLFVCANETEPERALQVGQALAARLTQDLAEHIAATWGVESRLSLRFEKLFTRLLLPHMRHAAGGARKRYAGLRHSPGTPAGAPQVDFVGMEVVRRDWTELAKRVQRELYARLFTDRPVEDYLREVVREVRAGGHDDLLVYRKVLRKGLSEYTRTTPPHVAAARKRTGEDTGRMVSYVVTTEGAEPDDERVHPIDREHYVQKQVRPVAEPVLEVLGLEFDRVIGDEKQGRLF